MKKIISIINFKKEINNGVLKANDLVSYLLSLNNIKTEKTSSIALKDLIIDNRKVESASINTMNYELILTLSDEEITTSEDEEKLNSEPVKIFAKTSAEKIENIIKYINDQMQKTDILELKITVKINKLQYNKIFDEIFKQVNENYNTMVLADSFNVLVYKDSFRVKNYVKKNFKKAIIKNIESENKLKQYQQKALDLYYNSIVSKMFSNAEYSIIQRLYKALNININSVLIKRTQEGVRGIIYDNNKIEYINLDGSNSYHVRERDMDFNNNNIDYNEIDNMINTLQVAFN